MDGIRVVCCYDKKEITFLNSTLYQVEINTNMSYSICMPQGKDFNEDLKGLKQKNKEENHEKYNQDNKAI